VNPADFLSVGRQSCARPQNAKGILPPKKAAVYIEMFKVINIDREQLVVVQQARPASGRPRGHSGCLSATRYCGADDRPPLSRQEAQQRIALLADVSQSLFASTGLLTRNHAHVRADLLAGLKPTRSSDDQHVGERRKRTDNGMGQQSLSLGSLPGFLLDSCG